MMFISGLPCWDQFPLKREWRMASSEWKNRATIRYSLLPVR
jgi:hypothetical protein